MMGSAALLCVLSLVEAVAGVALDNDSIRTAVDAWLSNPTAAQATYGHISTWDTSGVTDMTELFCWWCETGQEAAASFNEDIGAWDTSGVTSMVRMFSYASAFNRDIGSWAVHSVTDMNNMFNGALSLNQDIGGWAVHSVTDMSYIFNTASAFDQDLGWCVDDGVSLSGAFEYTPCESASCGVVQNAAGTCAPTPAPTVSPLVADDSSIRTAVAAWLSDSAAAEATYGHISTLRKCTTR
jgi:hypothetical protein